MHRYIVALLGLSIVAVCTNAPAERAPRAGNHARNEAKIAKELEGLTPSSPQICIDSYRLHNASAEPFGATLLYRLNSRLVYRNDTTGGCHGLDRGDTLIDRFNPGNRYGDTKLCRGDPLYSRSLRDVAPSGSCTRGAWIAYTK